MGFPGSLLILFYLRRLSCSIYPTLVSPPALHSRRPHFSTPPILSPTLYLPLSSPSPILKRPILPSPSPHPPPLRLLSLFHLLIPLPPLHSFLLSIHPFSSLLTAPLLAYTPLPSPSPDPSISCVSARALSPGRGSRIPILEFRK